METTVTNLPGQQGRLRQHDAGRRDLLHARHHRRAAGVARGLRPHDVQQGRRPEQQHLRRRQQRRLDPDQPRRQVPLPSPWWVVRPAARTRARRRTSSSSTSRASLASGSLAVVHHRHRSTRSPPAVRRPTARRCIDTLPAPGGPHWGALDNLELGEDGFYHETTDVTRIAYSNYFVARTGLNGDHRVCIVDGRAPTSRSRSTPSSGRARQGRGLHRLRPRLVAARRVGSGEAALHGVRDGGRRHQVTSRLRAVVRRRRRSSPDRRRGVRRAAAGRRARPGGR